MPLFDVVAETVYPGKVTIVFWLTFEATFKGMPHPLEAFADWVFFRFGVVAREDEERSHKLAQMIETGAGQPMHEANQWLIQQHFEEGKKLPHLRDEWLKRREEEGKALPANVDDSMRQVIRRERKRRARTE